MLKSMTARERLRYRELAQMSTSVMTVDQLSEYTQLGERYEAEQGEFRTIGQTAVAATAEERAFERYLRSGDSRGLHEVRVTSSGIANTDGTSLAGYLVPQGFWANLSVALKAWGGASNDFRLLETPTGNPTPWPTVDPTAVTASVLTPELTTMNTQNPYIFGQGLLSAWTIVVAPVLVSVQSVQDAFFNIDGFLAERFGEAIGRSLASYAWTGTGSSQPLGIYPSLTAYGVKSGAQGGVVNLTAATTVKTFSGTPTELVSNTLSPQSLLAMVKSVDPAYYAAGPGCAWYMNSNQAWNLRSVVDTNGRPLINFARGYDVDDAMTNYPNYTSNSPVGQLFGFPVKIDNAVTDLTASTVSGPVFGNLSHAMVKRQVQPGTTVMRLDQRYSEMLAVGYQAYTRVDFRANDLRSVAVSKPAAT